MMKYKYRIVVTDPLTKKRKYLYDIDSINNTFSYTAHFKRALTTKDINQAKQYLGFVGTKGNPEIEYFNFIKWAIYKEKNS